MDEEDVRGRVDALCDALVAGDVDRVIQDFSQELRHNLGEVLALLPLPSERATVESFDGTGASSTVVLRLTGASDDVLIQTRWKERDGHPTIIEASHLARTETAAGEVENAGEVDGTGGETVPG